MKENMNHTTLGSIAPLTYSKRLLQSKEPRSVTDRLGQGNAGRGRAGGRTGVDR